MTPVSPQSGPTASPLPLSLLKRTQQSLRQAITRYTATLQQANSVGDVSHRSAVKAGVEQLQTLDAKLASRTLKVAVFGLVSRGKSAVINAILGELVLATGPLHGVTRWPRSVYWKPTESPSPTLDQPWQVEFIDTPGLDEIGGEVRSDMAQTVARQADLILFVVAGDITRVEYDALQQLRQAQKPLLLVFNKIDLYPDVDQQAIYATLQALWQETGQTSASLSVDDVIRVAAEPAPIQVRVEWPNGKVTYEQETPPPQIDDLRQALTKLLQQDAAALIVLNTLREAREVETQMISHVTALRVDEADNLIWRYAQYKAIAVALNPIAVLDLLGGIASDLVMIRSLARLYGFPITNYEASQLWQSILRSSGVLLMSEVGSALLGAGKTTAAFLSLVDSFSGVTALAGAMAAQASAAGYGTYAVGKAAKRYLEQGCTWGPEGVSAVMQSVLSETDSSDTVARLRQELQASLQKAPETSGASGAGSSTQK